MSESTVPAGTMAELLANVNIEATADAVKAYHTSARFHRAVNTAWLMRAEIEKLRKALLDATLTVGHRDDEIERLRLNERIATRLIRIMRSSGLTTSEKFDDLCQLMNDIEEYNA